MSHRGEQKIKGTIYVYEATAIWNKEKQRSEAKRVYIGKRDAVTGEFQPNQKYYELYPPEETNKEIVEPTPDIVEETPTVQSRNYGHTFLMQEIADKVGLTDILKNVFPSNWETILTIVMYLCSENDPLYLCSQWAENSVVSKTPTSQRISELLRAITEAQRMEFYQQWSDLRLEREYLALDITSISSWSE